MFRAGEERVGWFKLHLDPEAGKTIYRDEYLDQAIDPGNPDALLKLPLGKTALEVCTDYLRQVYTHMMAMLERRLPDTIDTMPIKFVITTPAMWSTSAQHATMTAAKRAGFGSRPQDSIATVAEPEAAAAYSLQRLNSLHGHESVSKSVDGNKKFTVSVHMPLLAFD